MNPAMSKNDPTIVRRRHSSHWGAFNTLVKDGRLIGVEPFEKDPFPSRIIESMPDTLYAETRIKQPMVRASWLRKGPGARTEKRGAEPFVPVPWDEALDMVANEVKRVAGKHGNASIFGGSYGWSSAGRFHHAKTQVQRFLGMAGGFTAQVNTYSNAAGGVILPHIFGDKGMSRGPYTTWDSMEAHTDLFVSFGGIGLKNTQVESGGMGEHAVHKWLDRLKGGRMKFVSITPLKDDTADFLDAEWLAPRPATDVAMMLGLAHTLIADGLHDEAYLARYTTGFEKFRPYVMGATDGQPKTADWAAPICEIDAETIRGLARRMAAGRTMIAVAYALQRAEHGEQTYWMAATLAAMLGQIGVPGGGCGFGYGSMHGYGNPVDRFAVPAMATGENPARSFIPVARIADMLLNPGGAYQYNGMDRTYPDIRLIYWSGGNPFHHHQDLNRLLMAWRKPETVIVNEICWTPTARHADIVLPATTTLERNDIGASSRDRFIMAMQKAVEPVGQARNDFDIFADLAERLGFRERFTEGRTEEEWLRHLYNISRQQAAKSRIELPDFDAFWKQGYIETAEPTKHYVRFEEFYQNPDRHPLQTPSGKIEIYSETIASFGYDDCPGHPTWMEPVEWLGGNRAKSFPLHMMSNQPQTRLHGQMDDGRVSLESKVQGREPVALNRGDAEARSIKDGDIVRVFNDRGAILAGAVLSDDVRPGVIRLSTGAWFDPAERGRPGALEKHGNPNVLTPDRGTSKLAQGPIAHSALVEVELYDGEAPPVTAFEPPLAESA
jgi:biotin/methionine sulfoxide reductase